MDQLIRQIAKSIPELAEADVAPGLDLLGGYQVPIHPLVARELELEWSDAETKTLFHGSEITFEDYTRGYINTYG